MVLEVILSQQEGLLRPEWSGLDRIAGPEYLDYLAPCTGRLS